MEVLNALRVETLAAGSGIVVRYPARVVAIANVNLGTNLLGAVIDGITLILGDRILLTAQSTTSQNGVYTIGSGIGATIRAPDFKIGDILPAISITISEGSIYAQTEWQIATYGSGATVGSGSLNFVMKNIITLSTGDIIYADTNKTRARLSKPNTDSMLQMSSAGAPSWIDLDSVSNIYNRDGIIHTNRSVNILDNQLNFTTTGTFSVNGPTETPLSTGLISGATIDGTMIYKRLDNGKDNTQIAFSVVGDYFGQTQQNATLGLYTSSDTPVFNLVQTFTDCVNIVSGDINSNKNTDYVSITLQKFDDSININSGIINFVRSVNSTAPSYALGLDSQNYLCSYIPFTNQTILSYSTATDATANWTTIAYLTWITGVYGVAAARYIYFDVTYVNVAWSLRIWNGSSDLSSTTSGTSSGFFTTTFTQPIADSRLELQIKKNAIGGTSPTFYGIQIVIS